MDLTKPAEIRFCLIRNFVFQIRRMWIFIKQSQLYQLGKLKRREFKHVSQQYTMLHAEQLLTHVSVD